MTDSLRVGVVGAGAIVQVAHLPALRKVKGIEVVALCDNDLPKARALSERFGVRDAFDDIEELLRYAEIDAVAVCTPNHLHEAHVVAALSAGKHVLCERPLTLESASAQRVVDLAARHGKIVVVGMNHRFRHDVQAVRSMLQNNELGDVIGIRAGWYAFKPSRQMLGWRLKRRQSGGGAMLDLGLPLIDLALWLTQQPVARRVSAVVDRGYHGEVEDSGCAIIDCQDGLNIMVDVTWRHIGEGERFWLDLRTADGSASINPVKVFRSLHGSSVDITPGGVSGHGTFGAAYRAEWEFFVRAARGEVSTTSAREQVRLLQIVEAIYRSASEGRDVSL